MRIGTWNMASRTKSWDYVAQLADGTALPDRQGIDVLLVQEALPPAAVPDTWRVLPDPAESQQWTTVAPATRKFTTAIVVFEQQIKVELLPVVPLNDPANTHGTFIASSHPGTFRVAQLTDGDYSIIAVSAYGLQDDKNPALTWGSTYAATTLHRMLSDLTPLLDSDRGQRVVLGGDLNSGTQPWQGPKYDSWHRTIMQRLTEFGFKNCLPAMVAADRGGLAGCACGGGDDCRHTLTTRANRVNARPWESDHILAMPGLRLVNCFALNDSDSLAWTYSDHCPVVADFHI